MAGFHFTEGDGGGKFRLTRKPFFTDGLKFKLEKAVVGTWSDDNGQVINKDNGNSIRFKPSCSSSADDLLNINSFLNKKTVVYNKYGEATLLYYFKEHEQLRQFLENNIGRDPNDSRALVGTAKEVADKVLANFFGQKEIVCEEQKEIFFKTIKNGVEKLEAPIEPVFSLRFV